MTLRQTCFLGCVYGVCVCVCLCSDMITKQLDQYARVLREVGLSSGSSVMSTRLQCLSGNLIAQLLHHRDVTQSQFVYCFYCSVSVSVIRYSCIS